MLQRDHLMRQILAFFKALAKIMSKKNDGLYVEALELIEETVSMDEEMAQVFAASLPDFFAQVEYMDPFVVDKWTVAAEIMYEQADIQQRLDNMEASYISYVKTAHLLLEIMLTDPEKFRAKEVGRLKQIVKAFGEDMLPAPTQVLWEDFKKTFESESGKENPGH